MVKLCWAANAMGKGGAGRMTVNVVNGFCERGHTADVVLFTPRNSFRRDISEQVSETVLRRPPDKWNRMGRTLANRFRKGKKYHQPVQVSEHAKWSMGRIPLYRLPILAFRLARNLGWSTLHVARHLKQKDVLRALRLGYYLEVQRPDIVFVNNGTTYIAGFLVSRALRDCPPIVCIVHRLEIPHRHLAHDFFFWRNIFSGCQHVVGVSQGVADWLVETVGVSPKQITPIYNPACTPDIAIRAARTPAHPWFSDGGPKVVLSAGRLAPEKDYSTLIDAFQLVRAEYACRLVILGEGEMRLDLERRVRAKGLEEHVSLPGWANNPFSFMSNSVLFVLSSRREAFGNVLVEALASGCPAVSTDCPAGPAEILEDRSLLAPVGDPGALADVMLRALARPVDKASLRAKAAKFSVDRAMDRYEDLMDRIAISGGN